MTRVATMLTTVVTSITLGSSALVDPPKSLIWNASASAPVGLYAVLAADDLDVTDLVAVMPLLPMAPPTAARANATMPVVSSPSGKAAAASPTTNSFS